MGNIESVSHEQRVFPPSSEFVRQANVSGMDLSRIVPMPTRIHRLLARLARETFSGKPLTQF